jgi:D-alanyl-D-alanine carboxypeptidase/D-alanyl-D-alanine-endopeptidase (penicillin-binding protein 4)
MDSVFNAFQKDKALANASISFLAVDVASDSLLFTYRDSVALPPASTVKLFSTATALEILGNTYKPSTKIYADSIDLQDSILTGNIYIKGAADISLGSQYFNKEDSLHLFLNSWAEALRKKGIKKIKGNVIGDGSAFGYNGAPNGWSMEDLGNYYGAFHSGLSIYDNLVRFYFNVPAPKLKPVLIKSFPEIPNLTLKNQLIALNGVGDNSLIYGAPYGYDRVIRGSLSANSPNFIVKGSMPDPEIQFLQAFKSVMENNGILIEGDLIGGRSLSELKLPIDYSKFILLHEHIGKSVEEIVYWTNMKSINVFAETLTAWLGYESTKDGSTESGVQIMENFWKTKINTAGLNLTDGSGLSRSNSVSARNYCSLLKYMYTSKNSLMFMKSLPIAGQTGTLSNFCKGQLSEGKFIAKSGSMRRIKSYAGYMDTQSGKKIIFAIIVNNYNCSNSAIMKKLEPVMNALYLQ